MINAICILSFARRGWPAPGFSLVESGPGPGELMDRFSYKQVEWVLAKVLGVRPEHRTSLTARLLHLRRLGVTPAKPGKGRPVAYSRSDVLRWVLFLELAHAAIEPSASRDLGERVWKAMSAVLLGTTKEPKGDWLCYLVPSLIAPPAGPGEEDERIALIEPTVPSFVAGLASDFAALQAGHRRLIVLNLSELRRVTDAALEEVADVPPSQRGKIARAVANEARTSAPKRAPRRLARKKRSVMT